MVDDEKLSEPELNELTNFQNVVSIVMEINSGNFIIPKIRVQTIHTAQFFLNILGRMTLRGRTIECQLSTINYQLSTIRELSYAQNPTNYYMQE